MKTFLAAVFAVSLLGFSSNGLANEALSGSSHIKEMAEKLLKRDGITVDCSTKEIFIDSNADLPQFTVRGVNSEILQKQYMQILQSMKMLSDPDCSSGKCPEWDLFGLNLLIGRYYQSMSTQCGLDFPGYK